MLTNTIKRNAFRVLATLAFAAAPAFANMILVNNPSFEQLGGELTSGCSGACLIWVAPANGALPGGWNSTVQRGGQLQPVGSPGYISKDFGDTGAWSNDGIYSQTVGAVAVVVGTPYMLRVDIGEKFGDTGFGGSADLLIGGAACATCIAGFTSGPPAAGGWATYMVMYTGLAADAGKSITIELQNIHSGVYQANFDNVRMDTVPEPASFLLIGSALLALKAFRRRRPIA